LLCLLGALLSACASRPVDSESTWMPRAAGTQLRVLSWNVARERFFAEPSRSARLLQLADPDVLLLDEMDPAVTANELAGFLDRALPGSPWQVVLGREAGNRERGSIAARLPLRRVDAFDRLHYSKAEQRGWIEASGEHAARLRRQLPNGVAAAGAIADVQGHTLLLVSFDLQCCGNTPQSWEERRRQAEAALIRGAIDATLASAAVLAIVGGDANAVQGEAPLRAIREGRPALRDVQAAREDGSDWTWDGRGTPFPSSKLDYLWVSPGIRVLQARLLDTEAWAPRSQVHRHVRAEDSRLQSPHRPIVADLVFGNP
jgi:hypothetical protein